MGSHEIIALLGKGGMGEVYRARDRKLKREVAIKILPEEFARDHDRLSRFQREAEVLASLNHTNIAAIYDLQEANGFRFLVLELVEGETLAERIARGPVPVDEALGIAKQICEALEAAHEKGIIHRDLKPANVKIQPDGKAKVLDFGLAKALEIGPADVSLSNSPTMSLAATNAGVILGTAAYMSPEQAKGKKADKRADIWALGVVLYEMLTGRMMFSGETVSETMAAVMMKEPDWGALPADTPSRLRDLLRRCLVKEPRNRVRDAGDARIAIEEAIAYSDVVAPAGDASRSALPASRPLWRRVFPAAAMLAVIVAAVYIATIPPMAQPGVMRFSVDHPDEANFSDAFTGVLSPDGQRIAFAARDEAGKVLIWIRSLSSFTAQPLTGTDGATDPFWSPDSRFLGFFADGKLKKIEISGGPPQTLCAAGNGRGGAWNADGDIIFSPSTNSPLFRVSAEGGEPEPATTLDSKSSEASHRWPSFLPDGRRFIYKINATGEADGVYAGSLDSDEKKRLLTATGNAVFASAGYLLFLREDTLVARAFDPKRLEFTSEAEPVAEHIAAFNNLGSFSVSSDDTLLFRTGGGAVTQLTWFDRDGKNLGTAGPPGNYGHAVLSPDEKKIALTRDGDVWLMDLVRGTTTRFTFDAALDQNPVWSPDGLSIVFTSNREGGSATLYQKVSSGAGKDESILKTPFQKVPFGWSLDGRFITYHENGPTTAQDLYVLPMTGDRKPILYLQTEFSEYENVLSPDSLWMAYASNESGRYEVYVQPFPASGGKWQISTAGGVQPQWRRDGKELFYVALDGTLMAADVKPGSTFEPGVPHPLFKMNTQVLTARNSYSPTADGRRFLVNSFVDTATSSAISVVVNWAADLKK